MWKYILGGIIVLVAASLWYSQYATRAANEGVEVTAHVKGNPDGPVTLVEYSDFECPACKQFAPYVDEVVAKHSDVVRFEYRHFPLVEIHQNAVAAGVAAEAAGQQDAFFQMHDALFENQQQWANSPAPQRNFVAYAEELGLDVDQFSRHLDSSVLRDAVLAGYREAAERQLPGTPTFILNGERMTFESFADFTAQIDAAAAEARGVDAETATSSPREADAEIPVAR